DHELPHPAPAGPADEAAGADGGEWHANGRPAPAQNELGIAKFTFLTVARIPETVMASASGGGLETGNRDIGLGRQGSWAPGIELAGNEAGKRGSGVDQTEAKHSVDIVIDVHVSAPPFMILDARPQLTITHGHSPCQACNVDYKCPVLSSV